jgi:nitroimidazol reductase NimA-like FMN-containing flavoprotein (pyridoxamine 5'-phosphate oxidase superfamily)
MTLESNDDILAEACRIAANQPGGSLATVHAEDATPYVTYVLFHLRDNGELLFGSRPTPQHARNIAATPEASFLIDNRDVIAKEWTSFDRVIIEGRSELVAREDPAYHTLLEELRSKNEMAAQFTEQGNLYRLRPRRIILRKGATPQAFIIEFEDE